MAQQALLADATSVLDRLGIPYMHTGSHASSLHGQPRSTHDIDLVVDLASGDLAGVLAAFPEPRFYVSDKAARDAVGARTMFNILDTDTGDKIDFWMLTNDPFDRERFRRRQHADALGRRIAVPTPEDTILMKLRWAAESGSTGRHLEDARHVYELNTDTLDRPYLHDWATRLGVTDQMNQIRE